MNLIVYVSQMSDVREPEDEAWSRPAKLPGSNGMEYADSRIEPVFDIDYTGSSLPLLEASSVPPC